MSKFRQDLRDNIKRRQEKKLSKFGSLIALGILDGGGRNAVIKLSSQSGNYRMSACIGLMLFTNYWYWFPFINFLPLSFAPTALIGIDMTLNIPKEFQVRCKAKKSLFDYPEFVKPIDKDKKKKKQKNVELSTTVKASAH